MDASENATSSEHNKSFAHILYKRLTRSIQSVLHIQSKNGSNLGCCSSETSNRLTKSDKESMNKKKKQRKRKKTNKLNKLNSTVTEAKDIPVSINEDITEISTSKDFVSSFKDDTTISNEAISTKIVDDTLKIEPIQIENLKNDNFRVDEPNHDEIENIEAKKEYEHDEGLFVEPETGEEIHEANQSYCKSQNKYFEEENYEALLVGSSIVMDIDASLVFPTKKCFFKSICGGETIHIMEYLKENEFLIKNCKYFVLACASNDCGSLNDMNHVINMYTELAQYLKNLSPDSILICNKLIPRTYSVPSTVEEFEERRHVFNNYLEFALPLILPCKIIDHPAFEVKSNLSTLLYDGVHISLEGLPVYIHEMRQVIDSLI